MPPVTSDWLNHRLLIITGKGGVGKTTMSLVVARHAADHGKRVLILQLASTPWVNLLFGKETFDYLPTPILKNIDLALIDPRNAFREYVADYMHVGKLAELALNRRIVTHFLDAIPGLNEILVLGKIYTLAKESLNNRGGPGSRYDLIIVDAPATGHGLSLLQVPLVLRDAVKAGPLKTQADRIVQFLSQAEHCRLLLVTLLEDLPVQETIDLANGMKTSLYMTLGPVIANAVLEPLPSLKTPLPKTAAFEAARFYRHRVEGQMHHRDALTRRFGSFLEMPFQPTPSLDLSSIDTLSHALQNN